MSAAIYLHPISRERDLLAVCAQLKARNYVVPDQPGKRFARAYPDVSDAQVDEMFRRGDENAFRQLDQI